MQLLNGAKKDLGTFTTGENGTFYIPDLAPCLLYTSITCISGQPDKRLMVQAEQVQ